nr:nodulation protein [Melilotus officinalis]
MSSSKRSYYRARLKEIEKIQLDIAAKQKLERRKTAAELDPLPWDAQLDSTDGSIRRKYDVFLSFRGEDTRASFISHLFPSLQNSGIIIFKDDHSLQRENRISKSLLQSIENSQISVVVFSKNTMLIHRKNESEVIKDIVENVTRLLDKTDLFIADNPVGVESRVQDIFQLLDTQRSNDVLLLGMWGMGGIGKTTIAKDIYNKIGRNFEGRSFLANIREVWEQDSGQLHLQEQLLYDIFKETTTKIQNVELGKSILKERLCHKRVLLVLDDVNKLDQLNALCGSCKWFAPGSRIIITTRDNHILTWKKVDKIYLMKEMDESESLELFSWHAFKQTSPKEDFSEISRNVAKIPNDQVHTKLKISYDGLDDDTEKSIFLDFSCFFIGMDRNDVIHILNGSRLFAEIGISVLVERSLVTVDDKNKLGMHDLLRDMEIIHEKSPKEPEERSRLWFHEDVLDVLLEHTGTKAVEGLTLKLPGHSAQRFNTKAFENMKKLRLLQLSGAQLDGDFKYLSSTLRWLHWNGFPLTFIPSNFYQRNIVSIELENSNVKLVWKEMQRMEQLKILNLSHSHYLTQTPDFSYLPNLEKLVLKDCPMLSEVSHSIGHLNKILLINLKDCISLCNLPRNIYTLKSLKTLILSGCLMIDKLEEDLEQMESLTTLVANNTGIKKVPFSIVRSKSIGFISLCGYEGFSHDVFPSIIWSWMSPTDNLSPAFKRTAGMSSLVLDATNSISRDLSSISNVLPKLQSLWLECGSELQLSQDVTRILNVLSATSSKELESTATTSQVSDVKTSSIIECLSQVHASSTKSSLKSLLIQMGMSCLISNILKERILQNLAVDGFGIFLLPNDNYPDWRTFNSDSSSVIFEVPQVEGRNLKTMMCIVYSSSPDSITSDGLKNVFIVIKTKVYLVYEPIGEKMDQCYAPDKNVLVGSGDENECAAKRISLQTFKIKTILEISVCFKKNSVYAFVYLISFAAFPHKICICWLSHCLIIALKMFKHSI